MLNETKLWLNKLLVIVSTNLLALGIIGIFSTLYFAANWYWNIELGQLPNLLALGFLGLVNLWLFTRARSK
jgi:hypothetical protein